MLKDKKHEAERLYIHTTHFPSLGDIFLYNGVDEARKGNVSIVVSSFLFVCID